MTEVDSAVVFAGIAYLAVAVLSMWNFYIFLRDIVPFQHSKSISVHATFRPCILFLPSHRKFLSGVRRYKLLFLTQIVSLISCVLCYPFWFYDESSSNPKRDVEDGDSKWIGNVSKAFRTLSFSPTIFPIIARFVNFVHHCFSRVRNHKISFLIRFLKFFWTSKCFRNILRVFVVFHRSIAK